LWTGGNKTDASEKRSRSEKLRMVGNKTDAVEKRSRSEKLRMVVNKKDVNESDDYVAHKRKSCCVGTESYPVTPERAYIHYYLPHFVKSAEISS